MAFIDTTLRLSRVYSAHVVGGQCTIDITKLTCPAHSLGMWLYDGTIKPTGHFFCDGTNRIPFDWDYGATNAGVLQFSFPQELIGSDDVYLEFNASLNSGAVRESYYLISDGPSIPSMAFVYTYCHTWYFTAGVPSEVREFKSSPPSQIIPLTGPSGLDFITYSRIEETVVSIVPLPESDDTHQLPDGLYQIGMLAAGGSTLTKDIGYIKSTVKRKEGSVLHVDVSRRLACINAITGEVISTTVSNPVTGLFEFKWLNLNTPCIVLALDDEGQWQATSSDLIYPKNMFT